MIKRIYELQGGFWIGLRRKIAPLGLIVILILIFLAGTELQPVSASQPPDKGKVGPGVIETLRAEGEVNVMIALVEPASMRASEIDLPTLKGEIASMQDQVLSQLYASDYRARHKYQAIPALAGKVMTETGLTKLVANPYVVRIDLDVGGTGSLANSVPLIGADGWHARGITGDGIVVAVLDSGLDTDHDDLADDLIAQECFLDNDGAIDGAGLCPNGSDRQTGPGAAEDDAGHGTHVTGIITSGGAQSSVGVAPDADIVSIKVTAGPSFSGAFSFFSEIVAALDFIINNRPDVQVINMSLGTDALFSGDCDNSTAFNMSGAAAINTLRANGVIAFASSGNDGSGTQMTSPACLSNVVSVGATNNADNVASVTNSNASTDIMAPGVSIVSSGLANGTATASGTSMASPHAAGCAALLIEAEEAVTPDQIETRLESSPIQVTDPTNNLTFPRIDCTPPNTPPMADAGGPYTTEEGADVMLDGNGSSDPDGDALTYEWDLNDDLLFDDATGPTPIFDMVGQDGVFMVRLRVTDPEDAFDIDETTVTVNNVAPSVSLASDAPQDEGSPVTVSGTVIDPGWLDPLSATIDWDDSSPIEAIAGTLENVRPDATLTFNTSHTYGDNGSYNVEGCASDDDTTTCETIILQIDNVPPEVQIDPGQVTEIDEGEFGEVLAHFSDPGWLDTYTSLIDWGDGENEAVNLAVTVDGPPTDQGEVSGSHQYGDNGLFSITITVIDDDGGAGADAFDLTVNNVDPTAEIDESGTILVNSSPTFLARAGQPLDLSGHSQDPGSDDLNLSWDWDDGPPTPDVTTIYLVNPPDPDPFPSPSVQPRDVTDTQTHTFGDACLYEISFLADDDDGGHGEDQANVLITGNADQAQSAGYWQHQYHGNGKIDFDQATLECYLAIVDYVSLVFNEQRDASTIEKAYDVLFIKQNNGEASEQLDRELLTVWLNFANGVVEYTELLDTDGNDSGDTPFYEVVAAAEAVRLDPSATKKEIKKQENILHHIKQMTK